MQTEVCDGADNDCDTRIDEGTNVACNNGTCAGQRLCAPTAGCNPSPTCTTGNCCLAACNANPGMAEVCNGLDDNCDGVIDDNVDGAPCCTSGLCGTGECKPGVATCTNGIEGCQGEEGPTVDVCDGLDNDCNGTPDDGCAGAGGTG